MPIARHSRVPPELRRSGMYITLLRSGDLKKRRGSYKHFVPPAREACADHYFELFRKQIIVACIVATKVF